MKKSCRLLVLTLALLGGCKSSTRNSTNMQPGSDYPVYGGNKAGNRYSPLNQINTGNVHKLQIAWMYNAAGIVDSNGSRDKKGEIQCQPIVVNGILYGTTPDLELFALNAGTGEQIWKFEPVKDKTKYSSTNVNRGVAYWENGDDKRILYTTGSKLYAINALDGNIVSSFGKNGIVNLHEGLSSGLNKDKDVESLSVVATSPGVIYKNNFIVGSGLSETGDAAPGHVRAFDVITGKLNWIFHTVPQPGEFGYDTWPKDAYSKIGATNNWSGLTVDEKRGTVYFGTGSPASDFYGGEREGTNLFANCIMSLDAETGKMKWYYQTIHHDLWDRDLPCPPNLTTIKHNGKMVDVVVQATKDGLVYVLDRDKGTSIFPVEERSVPVNGLPGEHLWPTQKYPLKPLPFSKQVYTEDEITDISPEAHAFIKDQFMKFRSDHKFTPPSVEGTLVFGYSGGAEWGGNSVDPDGILYLNSNNIPVVLQMVDTATKNKELTTLPHGNALYIANCSACHGQDRKGNGTEFPTLVNIDKKLSFNEIQTIVKGGRGRMPSFQQISEKDRAAITNFLLKPNKEFLTQNKKIASEHIVPDNLSVSAKKKEVFGFKPAYVIKVRRKLYDQEGYIGVKPPWGTLNAIDLNTGDYLWRVTLGEYPELTKRGIPLTGTDNWGGPVVTAGGLIFIAATRDERIRAFDKKTGKVLWEYQLPAAGFATPITYEVDGKQYIVIAAGGAKGQKVGGNYIAFTLK